MAGPSAGQPAPEKAAERPPLPLPDPRSLKKILVVRLSALGDCVHALAAIAALRAARPDARIVWAIDDRSAPLFAGCAEADELAVMPRRALRAAGAAGRVRLLAEWARALRAHRFDAAADLQGLARSALVAVTSGAPLRIGLSRAAGARELSWLTYNLRPPVPPEARHVAERSLALLAPLGAPSPAPLTPPRLPIHPEAAERVAEALARMDLAGRPFAVLNPGAGWATKRWPPERYAELAALIRDELRLPALVTWFGAAERELAARVAAGGAARPAPDTDLPGLLELLRRAALYVGSDTGPTHVAAAAGAPTVALFGAADPVRNRPLGERVEVVTAGLDCSPCWRRTDCRRGVECMKRISPPQVLAAARKLLAAGRGGAP